MGLLRRLVLLLAALRAAALTVLITGGNGGIGTELAVEFAKAGHSVISACRGRSAHVHERLVEEQLEARVRIILGLDVLDDAKTDAFFDALQAEGVVLDVLVNAAGAAPRPPATTKRAMSIKNLGGLDLKLLGKVFAANAVGPVRVTEAVLKRRLLRSPGGKIAHVSSKLGSIASNTATGQNRGIAVALLHPGYVATPMTGDRGDLTAAASAAGLYRRIVDDLDLAKSGTFFDTDGSALPW
ncbi:hypothetical protein JL720_4577 [Aureococcus anophagefferens]|nr:hypothetical protein JL720_4577 [Aureococcus anophagefferens]